MAYVATRGGEHAINRRNGFIVTISARSEKIASTPSATTFPI
ncbi:hypothetical protein IQ26_04141 [Mesorhizobium tianshanense]|uniref:Uncharacterized protein n=1 Tax=Mesorhizobium tianshanense TaxID=39844 RepID=A0A562NM40_9HYPH|nr:hypothetical protein IQ26_04141 [Mesorhizobium tianshanense]